MSLLLTLLLAGGALMCSPDAADVETFTLNNGMKIIVIEDHSIPNANMYLFWRVGSRNEYPGITGLSHFFEHMMFNGAAKYGPKEFDRVMEAHGGSNNAYTKEDVTVYTDFFPRDSLEIIFELEADRISSLAIDDNMVESERGVVLSERITTIDNYPFAMLYEQLKSVAFFAHPYRWSVIGYESDIKNWSKEDLQRYFRTYYAPNNCVVVIAGDVSLENVKMLAKKYFEPIPPNDPPRPIHTVEPEQLGEKRLFVKRNVPSPNILIAHHIPESSSPDYHALDLLDSILAEGKTSRLYSSLVDQKQLAIAVFTMMPLSFDPNLHYIFSVCGQGKPVGDVEAEILRILDDIKENGVPEEELEKAKNQKLMGFYRSMQTIDGKANNIGSYDLFFGDYNKMFEAPDEYNKVTTEDIKRVASQYFIRSNRTVGILGQQEED